MEQLEKAQLNFILEKVRGDYYSAQAELDYLVNNSQGIERWGELIPMFLIWKGGIKALLGESKLGHQIIQEVLSTYPTECIYRYFFCKALVEDFKDFKMAEAELTKLEAMLSSEYFESSGLTPLYFENAIFDLRAEMARSQ